MCAGGAICQSQLKLLGGICRSIKLREPCVGDDVMCHGIGCFQGRCSEGGEVVGEQRVHEDLSSKYIRAFVSFLRHNYITKIKTKKTNSRRIPPTSFIFDVDFLKKKHVMKILSLDGWVAEVGGVAKGWARGGLITSSTYIFSM